MNILLLGEYSNVHATLADGLRLRHHRVTVVSNGDFWRDYPTDIDVSRPQGPFGGLRLAVRIAHLLPHLSGYDVVQLINPMFFELKASRLKHIYQHLRRHNSHIVLCAMGMDYYWVSECVTHKPLRYSDFNLGEQLRTDEAAMRERQEWMGTDKERLNQYIANDCDAIVSGLYEYHVCYHPHFPQKEHYIPFPIDIRPMASTPPQPGHNHKPTVFIGITPSRSSYKGTDIMLEAAREVLSRHPGSFSLVKAEGLPFQQYQQLMDQSDILLDQLYSHSPSMNTLLAMSKGIVPIGGGEAEHYQLLNETTLRPIVNVQPTYHSVVEELEQLVLHPERLPQLKAQCMEYVSRHHNHLQVARQYEQLYLSLNSN